MTTSVAFVSPIGAVIPPVLASPPVAGIAYMVGANVVYLARRSRVLSKRNPTSMKDLWKIRTMREDGVSRRLHAFIILAWQTFVLTFPLCEIIAYAFNHLSLFYSYPNASGCGIILEPLNVQHLSQSKRAKHQIRFDWHRFSLNVGNIGREGYRHPPSIQRNLPHLDIPKLQMKHWPWRRKETYKPKK